MQKRGGAPVGYLAELNAVEAAAVRCLRYWNIGPREQENVLGEMSNALGPAESRRMLHTFEQLCRLCVNHGRRPLMRHSPECKCLGADEACFANFIAAASEGDQEDAMLFASLIVRADIAPCLVGLAETFGLALKRMALSAHKREMGQAQTQTLH